MAFACFVAGLALVLLVDVDVARIVGVPLTFAGIVLGVASIATPEFLAGDRDEGPGGDHPSGRASQLGDLPDDGATDRA
jgi:hypothetical protein